MTWDIARLCKKIISQNGGDEGVEREKGNGEKRV